METGRRQYQRVDIEGLDIHCNMLLSADAQLVNLSIGGASIRLSKRLNIGGKYTLNIESKGNKVSLKGQIRWETIVGSKKGEKDDEVMPVYEIGMEFENVFTGKGSELVTFLDSSTDANWGTARTKGIRLRLQSDKTVLDYNENYRVDVISEGGMLLVADHPMELGDRYHMEIMLPGQTEAVKILGRVVSSAVIEQSAAPLKHSVGVEYLFVNPEDLERLRAFMDAMMERKTIGEPAPPQA